MNLKAVILLFQWTLVVKPKRLSQIHVRIDDQVPHDSCHSTLSNLDNLISAASGHMYNVTRVQVETVTVTLPHTWHNTSCVLNLPLVQLAAGARADSDIVIKNIPDDRIKTIQYGGCGVRSRGVILPHQRLGRNQNNVTRNSSYELMQALLKHEFGYFDTHGRAADLRFPELYNIGDVEFENCNSDPFKDTDYSQEAPTKQNLMCQNQSPMSVIKSSLISEAESQPTENLGTMMSSRPRIEYVISQTTRHLLVLDRSQQSKHVWKHLHNALYRYYCNWFLITMGS